MKSSACLPHVDGASLNAPPSTKALRTYTRKAWIHTNHGELGQEDIEGVSDNSMFKEGKDLVM
jgi:hypothetical protein